MSNKLHIALWNLENFFIEESPALFKSPYNREKDRDKRQEIGTIMRQMDADVWCLCEVGGHEALDWINRELLDSKYHCFFPSLSSSRGIDNGVLVRKDIPLTATCVTHLPTALKESVGHQVTIDKEIQYWLRGQRAMLEVQFHLASGELQLQLYHGHLKSPVTEIGKDPNGRLKRRAELNFLAHLFAQYNTRHEHTPVIMTGDFNCALSDPDLQHFLKQTHLTNYLEYTAHPPSDQWSLAQRTYGMKSSPLLIDFMLIRQCMGKWIDIENSGIWSVRGADQKIMSLPKFAHFRHQLPSDHRPQILALNFPENESAVN